MDAVLKRLDAVALCAGLHHTLAAAHLEHAARVKQRFSSAAAYRAVAKPTQTCSPPACCCLPAGLPLTDAKLAGAYAVVSAHDAAAVDWAAFSDIPTLVILMGGRALPLIVQLLQATGWPDSTPVSAPLWCYVVRHAKRGGGGLRTIHG